ncbi:unnamed protein product [Rotaria sordida]|uniref:Uncharacterized protein n=1 Tax=Rotaria sordida TaxID=392033 RepID=A0A819RZK9_9BILA|nr:unnamed protein product [Rotaria sordida]CAF3975646.1 unnamed protein product [Rotaria sordida]CAF4056037.1 unnamed protein product [Rotaria sordida]
MTTIHDIIFDENYSHATHRFLLLDDHSTNRIGPLPVIPLSNALLMTFIHVFRNLIQCQRYISDDNRKMITLFISNRNIIDWNNQFDENDNNIDNIHLFCDTYFDYIKMKRWDGCYRRKIQGIHLPDEVDYTLLKLGVDYIHSILPGFREDRGLCRKFCADARQLIGALDKYFQDQMDNLDDSCCASKS